MTAAQVSIEVKASLKAGLTVIAGVRSQLQVHFIDVKLALFRIQEPPIAMLALNAVFVRVKAPHVCQKTAGELKAAAAVVTRELLHRTVIALDVLAQAIFVLERLLAPLKLTPVRSNLLVQVLIDVIAHRVFLQIFSANVAHLSCAKMVVAIVRITRYHSLECQLAASSRTAIWRVGWKEKLKSYITFFSSFFFRHSITLAQFQAFF